MYGELKMLRRLLMGAASCAALAATLAAPTAFAQSTQPAAPDPQAAPQATAPQATPAEQGGVEEIIVTGFRKSLADALENKRQSNLIIESVTAEDMGKMPDQDIAESLQRLSGVQIDRDNGQGTRVRIRGLSQNVTVLNDEPFLSGLEAYASGEGSGGGGNTATNSLEAIPSDLIAGVDVYKSPQASLVEGGMGGIINLKTRSALDTPQGWTVGGNFRMTTGEHARMEDWTPIGAIVGTYNFNNKIGITAAFSYSETDTHSDMMQGQNRSGWAIEPAAGTSSNPMATIPQKYISPELLYFTDRDTDRTRISGQLGIDYAVTDSLTLNADWLHSTYDILTQEASNKLWFNSNGLGLGIDPSQPYSIDSNGVIKSATIRALGAEGDSDVQNVHLTADNFHFGGKWDNGGPFRAKFKVAYATSEYNSDSAQQDVEYSQYNAAQPCATSPNGYCNAPLNPSAPGGSSPVSHGPAYSFNYVNNGTLPSVSYNAPYADLISNPNNAVFKSAWAWNIHSKDDLWSGHADGEYDADFIKAIKTTFTAGVRYTDDKINYSLSHYELDKSSAGQTGYCSNGTCYGTYGYYMDPAILNEGMTNAATGATAGGNFVGASGAPSQTPPVIPAQTALSAPNRAQLVKNFFPTGNAGSSILVQNLSQMQNPVQWLQGNFPQFPGKMVRDPINSFVIESQRVSGYAMADMGSKEDRFHLNIGARIVDTVQKVTAGALPANPIYISDESWDGSNAITNPDVVTAERHYTDILPSMNLVLDVAPDQKVRFSAARVMSPPSPYDLGRGAQYNFTRETNTAGKQGFAFVGGSGGNPNLDPFRATQIDVGYEWYFGEQGALTFGGFYKSIDTFIQTQTTSITVMDDFGGSTAGFTAPSNGAGGSIKGFEIGAQYAFDFGVGFNANYTYSLSTSSTHTDFAQDLPIPGVSLHALTAQTYYQKGGLEARLSYSWRSSAVNGDAIGSTFAILDATTNKSVTYGVFSRPYGQLDAQLAYQFTPEFGITFEAINLTDESQETYLQFKNQPFTYVNAGRRFMLGGRFKFGS
ncbi:TonB-dependent receptor [Nitrospirillum viridazoti]|uniref:TonB-dependent receptor n=1 Tax=Nitrospirillum amazonense TaxID=28077 RepID=A0A560IYB0_9PROT|nr:TonB-dependent receptor [Nitrospirillum amazonense]TWB63896.1 TonB-dependent receptor [Nitrospirillum amazonense]